MRSLTPTDVQVADIAGGICSSISVDPESGAIYAAVERDHNVDIVRLGQDEPVATIPSLSSPFSTGVILDLHYFADDRSLVLLLYGGDIAIITLEDGGAEVVGSVESGIKAAAWSPDEEQLLLITGEDNLVCMTRGFDIVHEEPLRSDEFGDDGFINVGWGSKSTQFHGSLGKGAASSSTSKQTSLSHHTDDGLPCITFRGDAAFFAVSSLDAYDPNSARRQIRIYSRDPSASFIPKLSSTSESLPGLEGAISWRPSGNLLSGLVRYGYEGGADGREGRWDVAMLERNGLRHGGFELREGLESWKNGRVRGMGWNSDSEVLAIWIQRGEGSHVGRFKDETQLIKVQLWSMKNYHYYLKQEIVHKDIRGFKWHPELPLTIYIIGTDFVQTRTFVWDTYVATLPMPNDTATVIVVDGTQLLITPFRTQNIPPPMSSYTITLPGTPTHVSHSSTEDSIAVLFPNGHLQIWDLNARRGPGRGKVADPKLRWEVDAAPSKAFIAKQVGMGRDSAAVLFWVEGECKMAVVDREGISDVKVLSTKVDRILADGEGWAYLDEDVLHRDTEIPLCTSPQDIAISDELVFALSSNGKMIMATSGNLVTLATSITSFVLTPDYLIYASSTQASYYAPLSLLRRLAEGEDVATNWETRRIERGALAVVACPSTMCLVLQMPRGNLESIYPRPLVLAVVRRDVLSGNYRSAFITCRKHRLDLNILFDLAPKEFMVKLDEFVKQIPEVDYLNLFVSALNGNDISRVLYNDLPKALLFANKVNTVCDALRVLLEKDVVTYIETILTTHVCKSPPDYESGLRVLLQLQVSHPTIVEDAIKYIIFLSEVDKLYDVALGMYNFQLVLMIAQYSQKDPKEYLPFLRELRALDKYDQRFRIDDHLGRRESALRNLKLAGEERFGEASDYLARYELYDEAFKLYTGTQRLAVYDLYGDYLYDRRDFTEAALAYILGEKLNKALKAYEKAHAWRELFTLALRQKVPQQALVEMCERVTDHLASRGRHLEASQVFIEYTQDVDGAVEVLKQGAEFSEAFRIASKHDREDLVESVIHPGLEEACEVLTEVFEEMEGQLDKEMNRLQVLRAVREEDPESFYIVDTEPALEGVDVATNATTAASAFTRYTVAPTTVFSQTTRQTGQTGMTSRTKHASRKRAAGRKGTVDEYEYLLASIGRLVVRVDDKSVEAVSLLRHLAIAHKELASELQDTITSFRGKLAQSIEGAWSDREEILVGAEESGGMCYEGGIDKAREVVKPVVAPWKGLGVLCG